MAIKVKLYQNKFEILDSITTEGYFNLSSGVSAVYNTTIDFLVT